MPGFAVDLVTTAVLLFGNRSALEWVIDQYQVSTDKRSGITNDPNRADDPQYILRADWAGGCGQPGNG